MKPSTIYSLGTEGNMIEIDQLSHNSYRLICRDLYNQNIVKYYVDERELKGLAEFLKEYLEQK